MYCKKCGKRLKDNVKFCSGCGANLEEKNKNIKEKQILANEFNENVNIIEKREVKENNQKNETINKLENKIEIKQEKKIEIVDKEEEKENNKIESENQKEEITSEKTVKKYKLKSQETAKKKKKKKSNILIQLIILIIMAILVYGGVVYLVDNYNNSNITKEKLYTYTTKGGFEIKYNDMEKVCVDSLKNFYTKNEEQKVQIRQIGYKKIEDNQYVYIEYYDVKTDKVHISKMKNTEKEIDSVDLKVLVGPTLSAEETSKELDEMQKKVIALKKEWEEKKSFIFFDVDRINTIALEK